MVLRIVGRVFIGTGVLILLFLAYQLVGTNLVTQRNQDKLTKELSANWRKAAPKLAAAPPEERTEPVFDPGTGIAIMQIPKIEVEQVIVEGVSVEALKKGPGHMSDTPYPGEPGNVVISGHRTTYGAPFFRLDELAAGDEIRVGTLDAIHTYKVSETKIVLPTDVAVIGPAEGSRLTLTTCNPRFSAKQRLIVIADLAKSEPRTRLAA